MPGLTPKQQRFVDELLIDDNGAQAAIRAGYSKKTAKESAARLLTKLNIVSAVSEARLIRSRNTGIDAAWVLRNLAEMFTADVADAIDEDGKYLPIHEWPPVLRRMLNGLDVKDQYGGGTVVKAKFVDRLRAIEMIGKHIDISAFTERHEITGAGGGPALVEVVFTDSK